MNQGMDNIECTLLGSILPANNSPTVVSHRPPIPETDPRELRSSGWLAKERGKEGDKNLGHKWARKSMGVYTSETRMKAKGAKTKNSAKRGLTPLTGSGACI